MVKDFRKLAMWEKSHSLVLETYKATASFPADERFGLTSQLRRAAASIPTNIAEGCGRSRDRDFARFLGVSMGSASETEYLLLLSRDLTFLQQTRYEDATSRLTEVKRMLASLIRTLRAT